MLTYADICEGGTGGRPSLVCCSCIHCQRSGGGGGGHGGRGGGGKGEAAEELAALKSGVFRIQVEVADVC
jgi:hypothetical protein